MGGLGTRVSCEWFVVYIRTDDCGCRSTVARFARIMAASNIMIAIKRSQQTNDGTVALICAHHAPSAHASSTNRFSYSSAASPGFLLFFPSVLSLLFSNNSTLDKLL